MVAAGNLIRASDINNLVTPKFAASTANTVWSAGSGNVRQDVAGLTFDVTTINPNAVVTVTWCIDCLIVTTAASQNAQFRLEVDGVAQGPLAIWPTVTVARGTCAATHQVIHASPDTYTYKITGISGASGAAFQVGAGLATMSAIVVDLAA